MLPKLIVIQGAPASGKTTVSRELQQRVPGAILVSKDMIKELLFDTQPSGDRDWSRQLGQVSVAAMYVIAREFLSLGKTVLLENAFYSQYARSDIRDLNVSTFEVYCTASNDVLVSRFKKRSQMSRHPGHRDDGAVYDTLKANEVYAPLSLGRSMTVDTSSGVSEEQYQDITHEVMNFLEDK